MGYLVFHFAEMLVAMMLGMMFFVRGCSLRDRAEMSAAMLLPVAAILGVRSVGLSDTLPWPSNSEHTAMFVGMLAFMLYRRERYTSGYAFFRWRAATAQRE